MRTALSSAAVPRASLDELVAALARHGLAALELRSGDEHGVSPSTPTEALDNAARQLLAAGVEVTGFLDESTEPPQGITQLVRALDTVWLLSSELPLSKRLELAGWARANDTPVAVVVGGANADSEAQAVRNAGFDIVWQAHPVEVSLAEMSEKVMQASGDSLLGVQLCGGGPEGTLHEGRGIGTVMARLAIAGFSGSLTLTPSDRKYHVLWDTWSGRRGGWGCGSKASAAPVEQLQRT